MFAHMVVLSLTTKTTKTLTVTSRKGRKINRRPKGYENTCAPAARSFYAKDHEHCASGRSPDFWLGRFSYCLPIHYTVRTVAYSLMSCSPVTVARLRRIRTDFPILPESHTGHLMITLRHSQGSNSMTFKLKNVN